ncbi:ABC transporter substrate-binding protein [Pseudonocardia zijingensis]|jgi:iron complex transport system substrate-binding protein|uniref:ABC transporter substrate-binding protein n=1 Tax=Pseudonocardia zijingensis TaxID=153376 RepID=A0ABP3YS91_9PSEU
MVAEPWRTPHPQVYGEPERATGRPVVAGAADPRRPTRAPEEPVLPPLTRRSLLAAAATCLLAGCASGSRDAAPGERLVTLDGAAAALALMTGLPQVGTASFLSADPLLQAIGELQAEPVVDVSGAGGAIDVERLATLRPGVVVGYRFPGAEPVPDGLATVHAVERTGDLDADCRALAAGMGVGVAVDELLADVHRRTGELAARLREVRVPTVSVLSPGLDGQSLYVLGTQTPAGAVVEALGLARPAAQRGVAEPFVAVSTERLTEHDADLVLLLTGPTADPAFLRSEPLWERLGAVRAGRVVEVDVMRWAMMSCALGSLWVLDDLAATLVDGAGPVIGAASPTGLERLRGYRARYARA